MNNETNQNIISNNQAQPAPNVVPMQQVPVQEPVQAQQVPVQTQQQAPQTLAQVVAKAQEKAQAPVDFNSLSPLEKQQLIDKAIKEAELKCKIDKPKGWNGLISTCILLIILCVACVIILNTLT